MFSRLYGFLASRRRKWYAARPELQKRLRRPVISVGALAIGGSGKTPVAAEVANILVSMGENPAILSRGYRRVDPVEGVVVVSNRGEVQASLQEAGDEPFMLARHLRDVSVLVAEDRFLAGRLAETQLGTTVHVLDDGFQHFSLRRDVDFLVLGEADVFDSQTLPGGRLRESPETASLADALVVEARNAEVADELVSGFGVQQVFHFSRELEVPRDAFVQNQVTIPLGTRVLAVAGIARPRSFVEHLEVSGYDVVDLIQVRDHYQYLEKDISNIAARVKKLDVNYVITTEKDMVRLCEHMPLDFSVLWVPLKVNLEPAVQFHAWLQNRLNAARAITLGN